MLHGVVGSAAAMIVATSTAIRKPNAAATAASGCVRRHNSVKARTTPTVTVTGGHATSSRRIPSRTDHGTRTPRSAQSRHTRTGGCEGRGSAHSARRAFLTMITV